MPKYDIANELNTLDPKKVRLYKDEFNRLRIKVEGNGSHLPVEPVMGFPLTNPDHFVSFVGIKDGKKDEEIGNILIIVGIIWQKWRRNTKIRKQNG